MPGSRSRIINALGAFNRARAEGRSMHDALEFVTPDLEEIAGHALAERDPDGILLVVSLIHALVDCCRGAVPESVADLALPALETSLDLTSLREFVLQGPPLAFDSDGLDTLACALLRFEAFSRFYAQSYGLSTASPGDEEELWKLIKEGKAEIPGEDLRFDSRNGVVWFTDEGELRKACGSELGTIDANRAYDRLGLDWSRQWKAYDEEGVGSSRAVLISASIRCRIEALEGLRIPTGLDGWCSLPFVPRPTMDRGTWPAVAGFTVDPTTGGACHPEGVHGRLVVPPGEHCPTEACGNEVVKREPDRISECGELLVQRALERIRR